MPSSASTSPFGFSSFTTTTFTIDNNDGTFTINTNDGTFNTNTNTGGFTTNANNGRFTTDANKRKFTTDTNDGLPSYSDVFAATAPLLHETFPSRIFAGTSNISFAYDPSDSDSFGYSFLMRDSFGCLQAKGTVDSNSTTAKLQSVNGTEMLKITKRNETNEPEVETFHISHQNRNIGTVKVRPNGPATTCLRINHNCAYPEICVRSLRIGDFAIYRPNSMTSPLCNIQMPNADIYDSEEFNGTIIFHHETGINTKEQLLCTAAAIAFKVVMKRKTTNEDSAGRLCGYCLGIFITILIIIGFVIWFYRLEKGNCERRKADGFSNYVDREC